MSFEEILKTFDLTPTDAMMIPVGAVLFFLFYKIIAARLFVPFMELFDARERATFGAEKLAAEISREVSELTVQYETTLREARAEAMEQREKLVAQAKKEAAQVLDQSRDQAEELLRNARWEMASNIDELKKNAAKEADKLVDAIVEKAKSPRGAAGTLGTAGRSH